MGNLPWYRKFPIDIYGFVKKVMGPGPLPQECIETKDGLTVLGRSFSTQKLLTPVTRELRRWAKRVN